MKIHSSLYCLTGRLCPFTIHQWCNTDGKKKCLVIIDHQTSVTCSSGQTLPQISDPCYPSTGALFSPQYTNKDQPDCCILKSGFLILNVCCELGEVTCLTGFYPKDLPYTYSTYSDLILRILYGNTFVKYIHTFYRARIARRYLSC